MRKTGGEEELRPGMIVTVEPGIYLPGEGGVRIEDDVLITHSGCEVLSSLDRTLRRVPHRVDRESRLRTAIRMQRHPQRPDDPRNQH